MSRAKYEKIQRALAKERQAVLDEERYWASIPRDLPVAPLRAERETFLAEAKRFWPPDLRAMAIRVNRERNRAEQHQWPNMPSDLPAAVMRAVYDHPDARVLAFTLGGEHFYVVLHTIDGLLAKGYLTMTTAHWLRNTASGRKAFGLTKSSPPNPNTSRPYFSVVGGYGNKTGG
jgi:hypothetical protein